MVGAAIIPVEKAGFGRRVGPEEVHPVGHKEVQVTVVVIVGPGAATGASAIMDQRAFGDLDECPVAIVVEEEIVLILV